MKFGSTLCAFVASVAVGADVPKFISTSPAFWAVGVNPTNQKTVSLTFDQEMIPAFTDWIGRSSVAPNIDLNSCTTTLDRKTFEVKVALEAGKIYVLALNEKQIQGVGFQNTKGISAERHYLVFQTAGGLRPENAPPQVLRSFPPHGAQQLDPARTRAVVLTFDKKMRADKHGLHLFENNNPVDLSKSRFGYSADGKTFTLFYDFRSSQTYRIELNSVNDIGFASTNRIPLWPVQLSFTTGTSR